MIQSLMILLRHRIFVLVFFSVLRTPSFATTPEEFERGLQPSKMFGYFYNMVETPEISTWVSPELFHTQFTTSYDAWTAVEAVIVYRKPVQSQHIRNEKVMLGMITVSYVIDCSKADRGEYKYQLDWVNEFDTNGNSIGLFSVRDQPKPVTDKRSAVYRISKIACYDLMHGAGNKVYRKDGGLWGFPWKVRPVNKNGSGVYDYNEGLRWIDRVLGE
ncbi:hypothetical protein [Chitinilyticum piscinae]|uniref:Uncharacterized protein n=1 Tax=Chitinilyticum piscinae TaxID=2866724 RepID=A0A8J7FMX6_9NEIS|nr:hypothetical protein [Chitinilyticum piscinae]MBE9611037.1 hypothetical protein [Chitinilyticum piscinae]